MLPRFCKVCGKVETDPTYLKDPDVGGSMYWANPKNSPYTDIVVNFCGVQCSVSWHLERVAARDGEVGQKTVSTLNSNEPV